MNGDGIFVPPESRNIGMIFQDYALFPHLTVADNIGFGIRDKVQPALQQRIVRYEQQDATAFRTVLGEVQELTGVAFRYNEEELTNQGVDFDKPVQLRLADTTVGEILKTLLREVGLAFEVEANALRIRRVDAADADD